MAAPVTGTMTKLVAFVRIDHHRPLPQWRLAQLLGVPQPTLCKIQRNGTAADPELESFPSPPPPPSKKRKRKNAPADDCEEEESLSISSPPTPKRRNPDWIKPQYNNQCLGAKLRLEQTVLTGQQDQMLTEGELDKFREIVATRLTLIYGATAIRTPQYIKLSLTPERIDALGADIVKVLPVRS